MSKTLKNKRSVRKTAIKISFFIAAAFVLYSLYTLFAIAGVSLLFMVFIALILVVLVAYGLIEASGKVIVRNHPSFKEMNDLEVRRWAQGRYRNMNMFLGSSLLSALGLVALSVLILTASLNKPKADIDAIDILLSIFASLILGIGLYFLIILFKEIRFTLKQKESFINKIIEQIEFFRA